VSWYQLLSIARKNQQWATYEAATPPLACPHDGTPLRTCPPGATNTLYCPDGDFYYPRDWMRPALT
jgi:hypothetical protein